MVAPMYRGKSGMFESIIEDVDEGSERGSFSNLKKDFKRRMSNISSPGVDNSADTPG